MRWFERPHVPRNAADIFAVEVLQPHADVGVVDEVGVVRPTVVRRGVQVTRLERKKVKGRGSKGK
jgi:hypothetical protein